MRRYIVFSAIFILVIFVSFGKSILVFAQEVVRSNTVTTKVGNPKGPPPNQTNEGPLGVTLTCPIDPVNNTNFRLICGTYNNIRNNCGHGNPRYYTPCIPGVYKCPYGEQLRAAVDARPKSGNGAGATVYLPFINGDQSVSWNKVSGPTPINGGSWGYKVEYESTYNGKGLRLDLTHLNPNINPDAKSSGDRVGTIQPNVDNDGGGHLHTAASIDGKWADSISESKLCSDQP